MRKTPLRLIFFFVLLPATPVVAQKAAPDPQPPASDPALRFAGMPHRGPSSKTLDAGQAARFPEPESGAVAGDTYANRYFGLSYPLPEGWTESLQGPPPSDTGYYVLGSLKPPEAAAGKSNGMILISAWDMFFIPRPAGTPLGLLQDMKETLSPVYTLETAPKEVAAGSHSFARFGYTAAELHWQILVTEVRCHFVEFAFVSRDTKLLDSLIQGMNKLKLPPEAEASTKDGAGFPVCVKDYARGANVLHKVDPVMAGPRFTSVPVRIIIGRDGRVKHIHVIHGFPDQARSVEDALTQWVFKPYTQNGVAVEVETGIRFKFPPDGEKLPPLKETY